MCLESSIEAGNVPCPVIKARVLLALVFIMFARLFIHQSYGNILVRYAQKAIESIMLQNHHRRNKAARKITILINR